uniref:Uncharacterized protein n=1 Tax=Astatotilapia calliptera TaxID=8154 RepID=A0A3P8PCI3_ASTCA
NPSLWRQAVWWCVVGPDGKRAIRLSAHICLAATPPRHPESSLCHPYPTAGVRPHLSELEAASASGLR